MLLIFWIKNEFISILLTTTDDICNEYEAKDFWTTFDVIRLGRDIDGEKFRWEDDLGFSTSELTPKFLHSKEVLEYNVSFIISQCGSLIYVTFYFCH